MTRPDPPPLRGLADPSLVAPDCHCGEPPESLPDCRRCGEPREPGPICQRCALATWRGLCPRCRQADALLEADALPAAIEWARDNYVEGDEEQYDEQLARLAPRREEPRAYEEARIKGARDKLAAELLADDKHEGWANDQFRDEQGRVYVGAIERHAAVLKLQGLPPAAIPPLSARGHIERVSRPFRLKHAARHAALYEGAGKEAKRMARVVEELQDDVFWCDDRDRPKLTRRIERCKSRLVSQESTSRWHRGRARGQRERFHELARCGDGYAKIRCRNCEKTNLAKGGTKGRRTRAIGCSVNRACVACRDRRAGHRRAIFWRARECTMRNYGERQLFRRKRQGGRWSEKDFTLTLPTGLITGPGAVERRMLVLFAAWRHFSNRMSAHWRSVKRCGYSAAEWADRRDQWGRKLDPKKRPKGDAALRAGVRPVWHAAFETTPGSDGLGHPHWHVWFVGPYVNQDDIREWWADALRSEGIDVEAHQLIKPVLREVKCSNIVNEVFKGKDRIRLVPKHPKHVAKQEKKLKKAGEARPHHVNYIEGWTIATLGKKGAPNMSANVQARVYMTLEGKRTVRCTRGFLMLGYRWNACPACGADHIVVNSDGECVPALEATVITWRSSHWVERAPPLDRPGPHKAKQRTQEKRHAEAIHA